MSSLTRVVAVALCLLSHTTSSGSFPSSVSQSSDISNEYESDGDSYWVSTSRFDPMKDAVYGSITVRESMYMKFDLTWHGLTREAANRDYEGILRIGNPSSVVRDCSGHATRYPALYLDRARKAIQFSLSNDIDCWGVGLLNVTLPDLQIDSVYTVIIQYNQSWVYIQANEEILYNEARIGSTPDDMLYSTASIMLSDGLDSPADVTLSNMLILSYDDELTMFPTPGPSVAPSKAPSMAPSMRPTNKPTLSPTTTTLHPTPHPTEPVDFFASQIKMYAEYTVQPEDSSKMNLVDEHDIETVVLDIFPPWNITMKSVNIDNHHDSINVNMMVSVNTNDELVILQSFLEEEMATKMATQIEALYPWMSIDDVHYNHIINEIRLSSSNLSGDGNSEGLLSWLPFGNDTALWMILGAVMICCCSTVLGVCTLWYVCKLRKRNKLKRRLQKRGGIVMDGESAKQMSNLSGDSNSKSGDGYKDEPDTTGRHYNEYTQRTVASSRLSGDREEVKLMMTDGTYVRRKKGGKKKRRRPQYQRVDSNAEALDDDQYEDVELTEDEEVAAQFMTPWGPMAGGFELEEEADGQVTGAGQGGSGWEFEYDFNIDTFPFHLLPTLATMNEEEVADGNVTGREQMNGGHQTDQGGHRKNTSTLDILVEDHADTHSESVVTPKLRGHRGMGKKKKRRPHRRNTTKDSFECGVEDSMVDSTEESNLQIAEQSRTRSSSHEMMYDEGFGRRDTMPDPTSPALRSTITADPSEVSCHGGSDESRLSPTN